MLVSKDIKIKIRKNLISHYEKLNYTIINNEVLVNTYDLHKGSMTVVDVICDNCNSKISMEFRVYHKVMKKYNSDKYYCKKCKYQRIRSTNMQKYGVDNVMEIEEVKNKSLETQMEKYGKLGFNNKEKVNDSIINKYGSFENYYNLLTEVRKTTCLNKYGVDNVMKIKEVKEKNEQTCCNRYGKRNPMFINDFVEKATKKQIKTKIDKNIIISDDKLTEFQIYKKIIRNKIYKNKSQLFEKWDGYDYYDGEYIRDYLNLKYTDSKYPTIDHKISVFYGFTNGLSPSEISDIDNLCITKRSINSSKCWKTTFQFQNKK